MKYMLLIHQGTTPLPGTDAWNDLSEAEQNQVYADYMAGDQTLGLTPGEQMQPPETATTVRVQDGRTLTTDGPFVEAQGGPSGATACFEAERPRRGDRARREDPRRAAGGGAV